MHTDAAEIDEAAYLRTVAHPMRHRILAMLSEQESSPGRLAATLREKVNVVAYHVRRLHQLGLIDLVEVRRGRGRLEHIYAAPRHVTVSDAAWERLPPDERTRVLMTALRLMWDYLRRSAVADGFDRPEAHFSRTPMRVDETGSRALSRRRTAGWKRRRRSSATPPGAARTSCSTPAS
jgi:DNA-binding transcriptional ArsR family regulator